MIVGSGPFALYLTAVKTTGTLPEGARARTLVNVAVLLKIPVPSEETVQG